MRKWFLNLSTVAKLSLAFGAAVLVALIMGVVGYQSIMQLHHDAITVNELNKGTQISLVRVRFQSEAAKELLGSVSGEKLAGPKADEFLRMAKEIHDEAQKVFASEQTIFELSKQELPFLVRMSGKARAEEASKEADDAIKEIGSSLRNFESQLLQMPGRDADETDAAATGVVDVATARATLVAVIAEAQTLEGAVGSLAAKAVGDMDLQKDFGRLVMGGGALVGALIAILVAAITTRVIVEPLREMTAAAHRISEGDLTAEITHESSDEVGGLADSFRAMQGALRDLSEEAQRVASGDLTHTVQGGGELGESFNRMVESLNALLREIHEAGSQVRGSSETIFSGLQRNSKAAGEEAAAVDEVGESMDQLSETARSIASTSAEVERTADDASRVAGKGSASVGAALAGMVQVRSRVNEITQKTLVLGEKCNRISEVLKIIQDVAGEIHMLALNAAIESASSEGEHGKRFTVVAGEVRRLAERTKSSAEEIRAILTEIQEAAEATVETASQGAREVEIGSETATEARSSLEEVIASIHRTTEAAREISRSTQEQRQASERVAGSMRDISRAVRQMAEGTQEATDAVRELTALAERFGDLTGTFRTG